MLNEEQSTHRDNQRAADVRNHRPVECEEAHTQTTRVTEKRINDNVVRSNPADPVEDTERCEQESRDPIPYETAETCKEQEPFAGNMLRFLFAVVLVHRVQECGADKNARPDHARRPNQELSH